MNIEFKYRIIDDINVGELELKTSQIIDNYNYNLSEIIQSV